MQTCSGRREYTPSTSGEALIFLQTPKWVYIFKFRRVVTYRFAFRFREHLNNNVHYASVEQPLYGFRRRRGEGWDCFVNFGLLSLLHFFIRKYLRNQKVYPKRVFLERLKLQINGD